MPLEIAYYSEGANLNLVGRPISAETRTLSGTSADSAATPEAARYIKLTTTEAARYMYGAAPTASATTPYLAANEVEWISAKPGYFVAAKTA